MATPVGLTVSAASVVLSASTLDDVLSAQNIPGIILLSASGVVGMIFIVRWMVKFQKEFTQFYIEENKKLRERVDELETDVQERDRKIAEHERTINRLAIKLDEHEATIERLNRIIDRRRMNDD